MSSFGFLSSAQDFLFQFFHAPNLLYFLHTTYPTITISLEIKNLCFKARGLNIFTLGPKNNPYGTPFNMQE